MKVYIKDFLSRSAGGDRVTSAFHHFDPGDTARGYLLGLVSVHSPGDLDASNIARFVWNGVLDEFMKHDGGSVSVMKLILEEAQRKLLELIKNDEDASNGVELDIITCHYQDNNLYFGFLGGSKIHILHEMELVDVTSLLKENNVQTGSTQLSDDDVLMLSSPNYLGKLNITDIHTPVGMMQLLDSHEFELGEGCVSASTGVDLQTVVLFEKEAEAVSDVEIEVVSLSDDNEETEDKEGAEVNEDHEEVHGLEQTKPVDLSSTDEQSEETPVGMMEYTEFEGDDNDPVEHDSLSETENLSTETVITDVDKTSEIPLSSVQKGHDIRDDEVASSNSYEDANINKVGQRKYDTDESEAEDRFLNGLSHEDTLEKTDTSPRTMSDGLFAKPIEPIPTTAFAKVLFYIKKFVRNTITFLMPLLLRTKKFISRVISNLKAWVNRYLVNRYGRKVWFKRLRAKFSQTRIGTPDIRKMRLGDYRTKSLRNKRFIILGSTVLVLVALYAGYNAAKDVREKSLVHQQFLSIYDEVSALLEKANKEAKTDPEQAQLKLLSVEKKLEEGGFDRSKLNEKDQELLSQVEGSVLGVYDILDKVTILSESAGNISVLEDLLAGTNSQTPSDIAIYSDDNLVEYLLITDPGLQTVHRYNLSTGTISKIPDEKGLLQAPMYVDVGNDGVYVYDDISGVLMAPYSNGASDIGSFVALSGITRDDLDDQNIEDITEFAILGGDDFVYLLDAKSLAVYRSVRYSSGSYGFASRFLELDQNLVPTDFFADFSGYVLSTESPTFNRYYFNRDVGGYILDPWSISGLRGDIGPVTAGYAGINLEYKLYLFETDRDSIMTFEKPDETTGLHPGEMVLRSRLVYRGERDSAFSSVSDIVVDTGETRLYILDGPTIWSVKLR